MGLTDRRKTTKNLVAVRGGRKGGTNTTIPHQNLAKYRNRSYKWEKVDVVNTTNPPFK